MSIGYQERADELEARQMAYSFFADAFSAEVTEGFIASMADIDLPASSKLGEFIRSLQGADAKGVTQDVRSEFCALFLNMSAHPVFTSESVYLSENHIIMQEPRNQVVEAYRAQGLAVDKDKFDWPEDHISMEFLFMAHLCGQERALYLAAGRNDALGTGDAFKNEVDSLYEAQKSFFLNHIDSWIPMFIVELASQAKTQFYSGVAEYLQEFIENERAYFLCTPAA